MKYTKKQRHEIYKKALKKYDYYTKIVYAGFTTRNVLGACESISAATTGKTYNCTQVTPESFPELFLFKSNYRLMWLDENGLEPLFEKIKRRKIVLMFCIEMTR